MMEENLMRRLSLLTFIGTVMIISLAGCSDHSITATVGAVNTPQLSPTATLASGVPTSTSSSDPVATNTPPSSTHHQTPTPTSPQVPTSCGLVKATTVVTSTGNIIKTEPSDAQPLEDCFANAFFFCQSANFAITYIDGVGDQSALGFSTPDSPGGCKVAKVEETDFKGGSITSSVFTCKSLVLVGAKYLLDGCSNNHYIDFP
jgi:hypothetical protein